MPTCQPGHEIAEVMRASAGRKQSVMGVVEQNVLMPQIVNRMPVSAIAAMFGESPLALAALPGKVLHGRGTSSGNGCRALDAFRVGAHCDTVDLLQRILPHAVVNAVSREDKLQLLHQGQLDAVQVYDVTETLRLQEDLGQDPELWKLNILAPDVDLGYSQVIFATNEALSCPRERSRMHRVCEGIFEGWQQAINDPMAAAEDVSVLVPRGKLGNLDGAAHWRNSLEFLTTSVVRD